MLTLVEAKHTQTASSAIKALAQAADEVACASALLAPAALQQKPVRTGEKVFLFNDHDQQPAMRVLCSQSQG